MVDVNITTILIVAKQQWQRIKTNRDGECLYVSISFAWGQWSILSCKKTNLSTFERHHLVVKNCITGNNWLHTSPGTLYFFSTWPDSQSITHTVSPPQVATDCAQAPASKKAKIQTVITVAPRRMLYLNTSELRLSTFEMIKAKN